MSTTKMKAVINAEKGQLDRVQELVASRRYRSVSEFVRQAVDEKLDRIARDRVAEAVERYCEAGHGDEDADLIVVQAIEGPARASVKRGRRGVAR